MKGIRVLIATLIIIVLSHNCVNSQVDDGSFIFAVNPQVSFPLGNLKKTNSLGLGGTIVFGFPVAEKVRVLATFGGGTFSGKTYETGYGDDDYPTISLAQLKTGVQYFITKGMFLSGQLGLAHTFQSGSSKLGFTYAPVVGYEFGGTRIYDVSLRYEVTNIATVSDKKFSAIGLSIGYHL
jgi:hypothetical protein